MSAIDAVVFDLGGVVIDWDLRRLYRSVFDDEAEMERFLAEVLTPDVNAAVDRGADHRETVRALALEHPEYSAEIMAFHERWVETIGGPVPGTAELIEELSAGGVRLLALSNWSAETFPLVADDYPVLGRFEGIVLSGAEGVTKPDAEIYRRCCERYELDPARTVFIDDSPTNVEAARQFGMIALPFVSATVLRGDLAGLGIC